MYVHLLQLTLWIAFLRRFEFTINNSTQQQNRSITLLRLVPTTNAQLEFFQLLKESKQGLQLQLWRHPDKLHRHVDMFISAKSYPSFQKLSKLVDLSYEIVSQNILNQIPQNTSMKNIERFDEDYQHYTEIVGELKRLATIYSNTVTLENIGESYEKRKIYVVKIHSNGSNTEKPIIFINCGSHSREWLGVSACKYVTRKIIFDGNYDKEISSMLNNFQIHILPVLNPDGYVFSHENNRYRLWRKSRSVTSEAHCRGVDINRNFDYRWGGGGSSPDPCEEIYCGTKPFSEKESLSLARYLYKIRRQLVSYLDVHTYGQLWMSPWGYTDVFTNDYERQEHAMLKVQKAIENQKGGVRYKIGRSATTLYQTSGDALDWVYGRLGITYTFALELRPTLNVRKGFRYTNQAITPTGKDLLIGVQTIASVISEEKNKTRS